MVALPPEPQIAALTTQARAAAAERHGRLAAIVVACPAEYDPGALATVLRGQLESVGLLGVEIVVETRPGALRLLRMEYER